ncbi:hypothetical protein FRC10_004245 [Ceratobasidium sp. 414]|nr:hypothetical protein FRC10_004245 [Ceratobasidium sp. 414]
MVIPVNEGNSTHDIPSLKSLMGPNLGHLSTIHIFAVALTYTNPTTPGEEPLKDPVQDIEHLRTKLSKCTRVRFTTLYESAATRSGILLGLKNKLPECQDGDLFVLYLAGHAYSDIGVGYQFVTYYEQESKRAGARLTYRDILEYIQTHCPSGVRVLQVRDTCYASPDSKEEQMLSPRGGSVMVLAACDVDQLSRLVSAGETFKGQVSAAPKDLEASFTDFSRTILSPIQVPERDQQDPQLVPRESASEVLHS